MTAMVKRTAMQEVCETISGQDFGVKLAQALPSNVTLDRFTRVTLTAIQQNPEIITAERGSLYNSVIRCAQDGLIPDGREAALVIFKVKGEQRVSYLPMIFGLRKKAAEHGFALSAYVVYENDEFDYQLGIDPSIAHKPPRLGVDRGAAIGAYAVGTDKRTGEKYLEVMSLQEIEQVRAVSRAATSEYGPWVKWWPEQARKTVAKRLFKQLPLGAIDESTERVLGAIDDEYDLNKPSASLTLDEANVAAALGPMVPPVDPPPEDLPVDHIADEADWSEVVPTVESQDEPQSSFQQPPLREDV